MVDNKNEQDGISGSPSDLQNESNNLESSSNAPLANKTMKKDLVKDLAATAAASDSTETDNFNEVWKNFKRKSSGVVGEFRKREAYVPPSLKRKMKSEAAKKRKNKRNRNLGKHL